MTATYTYDVFSSVDGFGTARAGTWPGYWGKQGPDLLEHRLALFSEPQRLVLGATTFRIYERMMSPQAAGQNGIGDEWVTRLRELPTTVISNTLTAPLNWPDGTLERGDARDVVARLKEESPVPLRSTASLAMNRSLMAAGLVDRVQVTVFPAITGQTGTEPIFAGAADFDLELIENRVLDENTVQLIYRPTLH